MSETCSPNVCLWSEPDRRWKNNVVSHLKNLQPVNGGIVLLHFGELEGFDESIPLTNYIVNVSEEFKVFKNERIMFLNPKDLFQAIELCLAKLQNKNDSGEENSISEEDILQCHGSYIKHLQSTDVLDGSVKSLKQFIEVNNCADVWMITDLLLKYKETDAEFKEYFSRLKFLILGIPPSDVFKKVISIISTSKTVLNVIVETPLDVSLRGSPSPTSSPPRIEVTTESMSFEDISLDTENRIKLGSATEEYVEDIITAFLSLLVNSRNELALSKAMISPIIDLSHKAFTELKHLAEEKEMPLCQTAVSYVTRIRLGGKGYAPSENCPLMPHLKSLELFVDTLNQMQTLIEEDLTPISAIKRLINILKKRLLKYGSEKLKASAVEAASENLKKTAVKVLDIIKAKECKSLTPQVCEESLIFLHHFVNYVNSCCMTFDLKTVSNEKSTKRTPLNLPPLLGYFRSPEDESSCDAKSALDEESVISNDSAFLPPPPHVAYFHHSEGSSVSVACVDSEMISKTNFKDCFSIFNDDDDKDTEVSTPQKKNPSSVKGRKRAVFGELTNDSRKKPKMDSLKVKETTQKKETGSKSLPKKEKVKGGKKFKLIEGQGRITNFFIKK